MKQNALQLLFKQKRFDLIFKYLYLKYPDSDFVRTAYLENIRVFNGFVEVVPSDGIPKSSAEEFIDRFNKLYESIKTKGFDSLCSIPVRRNGEISDGATSIGSLCVS